jgi:hypothetical protein
MANARGERQLAAAVVGYTRLGEQDEVFVPLAKRGIRLARILRLCVGRQFTNLIDRIPTLHWISAGSLVGNG